VYVTGSHKDCTYNLWLIKEFKDKGKLSEGDSKFQRLLRSALENPDNYLLSVDGDTVAYPELRALHGLDEPPDDADDVDEHTV